MVDIAALEHLNKSSMTDKGVENDVGMYMLILCIYCYHISYFLSILAEYLYRQFKICLDPVSCP